MKKILFILLLCLSYVPFANANTAVFTPDLNIRIRHVILDMQDNYDKFNSNYIRIRTSLGLNTQLNETYSAYIKLLNENRVFFYNTKNADDDYKINEFIFESLYFEAQNLFDNSLTLRIGRQNLNYGENFLVSDGTPGDGSRTIYFNAAKFSFKAKDFTVDLIGHLGTEYDQYLPVFNQNDPKTRLNLQNEKAVMLFGKSNLSERFYIEPYYIFKSENNKIYEQLNTFGSYVKYNSDTLTVRGQLASQIREKQSNSANAFAGYAFIDKQKILFNDKITFGYIYLSGDKQNTSGNEGWNDLFGRGMFINSDLLGTLYIPETGDFGYWTNLQMYNIEYKLDLTSKFCLSASYNLLYANENVAGSLFGTGKTRGHLTLAGLFYQFNKNTKALIYAEYFKAGDFYNTNQLDNATFVKTEITMKF
jgi:hypothetical protein